MDTMGHDSDLRIMLSGLSALIGSWLYLFGLGQVYYAFKPSSVTIRNLVIVSFSAILMAYGVIHAAYLAIATTAKIAIQNSLDLETTTLLASQINKALRLLIYPIFALLSYLFISQVWRKQTHYPRWIILAFPLIPFLIRDVFRSILSGTAWVVVEGGYLNLLLVIFFTASTIVLWNKSNATQ